MARAVQACILLIVASSAYLAAAVRLQDVADPLQTANGRHLDSSRRLQQAGMFGAVSRPGQKFNIQLAEPFKYPDSVIPGVSVYIIDWKTPAEVVQAMVAAGLSPVCYFSAGSYEPDQPDTALFQPADLGNARSDFAGQRYLWTASPNVRAIMIARINTCLRKGFVGIQPDGLDMYTRDAFGWGEHTGAQLTAASGVEYARFLSDTAHAAGMGFGLTNAPLLLAQLGASVDWALNEGCYLFPSDCAYYSVMRNAGKAVYHIEYNPDSFNKACADRINSGFTTVYKSWVHTKLPWQPC